MDIRSLALGLSFALMWSSAFTTGRMIVLDAAPLHALALRFLLGGIVGIAIAYALGQRARLDRAQWKGVVAFGICQNVIYLGCNFVAMQWVEASVAAIIASTMPLVVAVMDRVVAGKRLGPLGIGGLAAGFLGVVIIMGSRLSGGSVGIEGVLLCLAGVTALAFAALAVRGASGGGNLLMVVGLQMLVGAVILGAVALAFEPWRLEPSPRLAAAFAYTVLVPGLVATFVWFMLVGRIGAVRASTFHFLNPFFGVVIAAIALGEPVGRWDILGVVIAAGGILAVQMSRAR